MVLSEIHREMVLSVIDPDNNFYGADVFRKNIEQQCKLSPNQCQAVLDRLVKDGVLRFFPGTGGKIKNDRYKCPQQTPEMEEVKRGETDLYYFHRKILLSLMPDNGATVPNDELLTSSGLGESDEHDYWETVDRLAEEGLIVRKGGFRGSVARIVEHPIDIGDERQLYEPFRQVVANAFCNHWGFRSVEHKVEITAETGPRRRGIFTRPDVTLLIMRTSKWQPGKKLEVITFELKTSRNWDDASTFEASGHR